MNYDEILRDKKLKITPQRVVILDKIKAAGHLNIEELYEEIRAVYPSISLATVYKNISSMVEADILKEIKVPNHKQKYELHIHPHIHLYCTKCGSLVDMEFDTTCLAKEMQEKNGFQVEDCSVAIIGVCKECQ